MSWYIQGQSPISHTDLLKPLITVKDTNTEPHKKNITPPPKKKEQPKRKNSASPEKPKKEKKKPKKKQEEITEDTFI